MCILRLSALEYCHRENSLSDRRQQLGLQPGMSMFFAGFLWLNGFDLASLMLSIIKWKRNYRQNQTTAMFVYWRCLPTLQAAITTYQQRRGIDWPSRAYSRAVVNLDVMQFNPVCLPLFSLSTYTVQFFKGMIEHQNLALRLSSKEPTSIPASS